MSPEGANEFLYWSKLLDWRNETLTPNPDLIYYVAFMDPGRDGPIVVDLPPEASRSAGPPAGDTNGAVLADRDRGLGGAVVLGRQTGLSCCRCVRPGSSGGLGSDRLHDLPRGDLAYPRSWAKNSYPNLTYFSEVDRAATSPPGRSRSSSPPRCEPPSGQCADDAVVFGSPKKDVQSRHRPLISSSSRISKTSI